MTESQDTLDLDDVADGYPVAEKELAYLRDRIAELERHPADEEKSHAETTVILKSAVRYLNRRDARVAAEALDREAVLFRKEFMRDALMAVDQRSANCYSTCAASLDASANRLRREAEGARQ